MGGGGHHSIEMRVLYTVYTVGIPGAQNKAQHSWRCSERKGDRRDGKRENTALSEVVGEGSLATLSMSL